MKSVIFCLNAVCTLLLNCFDFNYKSNHVFNNDEQNLCDDIMINTEDSNEQDISETLISTDIDEANMVNHIISSNTTTFEYFDITNYDNKTLYSNNLYSDSVELDTQDNNQVKTSDLNSLEDEDLISLTSSLPDNRTLVSNPKQSPYKTIGYMRSTYNNIYNNKEKKYVDIITRATAFLVGPNIALTAAHCTYGDKSSGENYEDDIDNPRFANSVEFYFGAFGSNEIDSSYQWYAKGTVINIPIEYYSDIDKKYDWTVIQLDRDIGNTVGYNQLISNWYSNNTDVVSYGYPGDKKDEYYPTMWQSTGVINAKTDNYRYGSTVYAYHGQSGSPFFITSNHTNYVCGILTSASELTSITYAVRLNDLIYCYCKSYLEANGPFFKLSVVSKVNKIWQIKVANVANRNLTLYYNKKMCNWNDAKSWTNLNDINYIVVGAGNYVVIQISENWFATSITTSQVSNGKRYITYANGLSTKLTLNSYHNIVSA